MSSVEAKETIAGRRSRIEIDTALIALAFLVYAAIFIAETSFVFRGVRYFVLQDDGMISMRFAHNLAQGHGLVWNPGGERVEGYSNFLWTIYMAALHLLPVSLPKMSLLVQATAALLLVINLFVVGRIASELAPGSRAVRITAVGFTAFYYPIVNWSLQGSELAALMLLCSAGVLLGLRILKEGRGHWALYGLLAVATLVRADGVVLYAALLLGLLLLDAKGRWRNLGIGLPLLVAVMAAQTLFRLRYFGDALPNTYYLKLTGYPVGDRLLAGVSRFGHFLSSSFLVIPLTAWFARPLLRDRRVALLAAVFLAQVIYSIYVGGDAWEWWGGSNRYLGVVMPLFFIVFVCTLHQRIYVRRESLPAQVSLDSDSQPNPGVVYALIALAAFVLLEKACMSPRQPLLLEGPPEIAANTRNVVYADLVDRVTTPHAKIAVVWAGATPYFSHRYYLDLLGKSDPHIARQPMHRSEDRSGDFWPGHRKWDYRYSIGKLKPDVVLNTDILHPDAQPYLQSAYTFLAGSDLAMGVRADSPNIVRRLLAAPDALGLRQMNWPQNTDTAPPY